MSLESMKEKLIGLYITEDLPVLSCIKPVDYFRARGGNVAPIDDNYSIRIVKQDGEDLPVTLDFNPTRVNIEVINNKIVDVVGLF